MLVGASIRHDPSATAGPGSGSGKGLQTRFAIATLPVKGHSRYFNTYSPHLDVWDAPF